MGTQIFLWWLFELSMSNVPCDIMKMEGKNVANNETSFTIRQN